MHAAAVQVTVHTVTQLFKHLRFCLAAATEEYLVLHLLGGMLQAQIA
jgi:hypothetical protein